MRSVLDPTGQVLAARPNACSQRPRSFDEGVEALLEALPEPALLDSETRARVRRMGADVEYQGLSKLRLAAVTVSFVSTVSTFAFCTVAIAVNSSWPLLVIGTLSASATLAISAFFIALRWTLTRRREAMRAALRCMAHARISDLEDQQLLRRSRDDPELASAILVEIMTEYTDAVQSQDSGSPTVHSRSISVDRLMRTAGQNHVVAQALRRLASDVSEAR
ncbi:hypothetical protein [Streptomyces sp. NPDC050535]|uniref:hypothetical protein n=1 Tax=Streptomyces sp. NPDC050535 TaxID=3365626 RepID=UPI00379D82BC